MPAPSEVGARSFTAAAQISNRLLLWRWRYHFGEDVCSLKLGELQRIATVGLDPFARLLRDQRWCDYLTDDSGRLQSALE
jgi:hypothetical protein